MDGMNVLPLAGLICKRNKLRQWWVYGGVGEGGDNTESKPSPDFL